MPITPPASSYVWGHGGGPLPPSGLARDLRYRQGRAEIRWTDTPAPIRSRVTAYPRLRSPVIAARACVREPSCRLGQIDDGCAVGSPQQVDQQRQLAAVSRSGRRGVSADVIQTDAILRLRKKLRLRRLAGLDRDLRILVDGNRFQPGRRQFKRKAPPGFVTTPERRSRLCVDIRGQNQASRAWRPLY